MATDTKKAPTEVSTACVFGCADMDRRARGGRAPNKPPSVSKTTGTNDQDKGATEGADVVEAAWEEDAANEADAL